MPFALEPALAWLQHLIAYPTVTARSNEALVSDTAAQLEGLGARVSVTRGTRDDGMNLYAVLGPAEHGGGVMLSAHTDVVDVEGQPWSRDPFKLHLQDDRAYGRGSTDMKGFIACVLAALDGLDPADLKRPLWIALSSDEEIGCLGVRPLLEELATLDQRPAWALVGEPTELRVVDRHKGKAAVRVEIHGLSAHSSLPHKGANAVAYAGRLITEILAAQGVAAQGPRDPSFQVPYTTFGIGPISGGVALNIIPDYCQLDLEVRTIPGDDPRLRAQQIRDLCAALQDDLRQQFTGGFVSVSDLSGYPGLAAAASPQIDAHITAVCGSTERSAVDFGTEAGLYSQRLGVPAIVCGPGSMADAHRADESLAFSQLRGCGQILDRLISSLR